MKSNDQHQEATHFLTLYFMDSHRLQAASLVGASEHQTILMFGGVSIEMIASILSGAYQEHFIKSHP